jgi:hypothetical protein
MSDVETERQRRRHLLHQIAQKEDLNGIEPQAGSEIGK